MSAVKAGAEAAFIALRSLRGEYGFAVFDELDLDIRLGRVPEPARRRVLEKTAANLTDLELLTSYFSGGIFLKAVSEELYRSRNRAKSRSIQGCCCPHLALKPMDGNENAAGSIVCILSQASGQIFCLAEMKITFFPSLQIGNLVIQLYLW